MPGRARMLGIARISGSVSAQRGRWSSLVLTIPLWILWTAPASGITPAVSLSTTALTWGMQGLGSTSAAKKVTLTNTSAVGLAFWSITITGSNSSDFAIQTNTCGFFLPAGANCSFSVTFTPSATGTRTATLTIVDDAPDSPQTVSLTGTGTWVSISPTSLLFGTQRVNTASAAKTVTITNMGLSSLSIIYIVASGDYGQSNNCGSLIAVGASCAIHVTFTPTASGTRFGQITLSDTDATFLQRVNLSGTGQTVTSKVSIFPHIASLTFTQTLQFQVTDQTGAGVNWSVDGINDGSATVGTVSVDGVYQPPQTAGSHTVKVVSAADSTQSDSAAVFVTDYSGVLTQHNDSARTGQNLQEIVLNTANVNQAQFGKLFSYLVDGQVYAQPLYVEKVNVPGQGFLNLIFVATEHDSVFAYDADGVIQTPIWTTSFINPAAGITTVPNSDTLSTDIVPESGITATPVVDLGTGTLYVVARTKEASGSTFNYLYRLYALDISTGQEKQEKFGGPVGPVIIQASVTGSGAGNDGKGNVHFNSLRQLNRPGLLLSNGVVYIGFGSQADVDPYHGWILGYDAQTLQPAGVFNSTPNGGRGGVWHSGGGLAADATGNVFAATGNGSFDADKGGVNYGSSILKLSGGLTVSDYFTPFDQATLTTLNQDLGSGPPVLLPDQTTSPKHLLVQAGKGGTIYLVDRDHLGQFHSGDNSQIVQSLPQALGRLYATPGYWQNNLYFQCQSQSLRQFRLFNGRLSTAPVARSKSAVGFPGSTPSISANGATQGIVWTLDSSAFAVGGPVILHAYDAFDVSHELYNSAQAGFRDQAGPAVKFTVPTVANGKVYVGTQTELDVYGILPQ